MREINFLPAWYPKVVRQKKLLTLQAWATAVVVVGGLGGLLVMHRTTRKVQTELDRTQVKATQTIKAVHQLDELLDLQRELVAKKAIVNELGLPVELSRVLAEMGSCTPREVTFTEVEANTLESAPATIAERAVAAASGKSSTGGTRRLELKLRGIAPTEGEVTTFWSRLIQRPFMSQVRLVNSTEKIDGDHKMRVFEITLNIALDAKEGA
jgi:hypothetical protein